MVEETYLVRPRIEAFRVNQLEIWTRFPDCPPELGKHIATATSDQTCDLIIQTLNGAFLQMEQDALSANGLSG